MESSLSLQGFFLLLLGTLGNDMFKHPFGEGRPEKDSTGYIDVSDTAN